MIFSTSSYAYKEWVKESEKDYTLRSIGSLKVTNSKGDTTIQGWPFDKIRVKLRKRAKAESFEQAQALFEGVDYRYQAIDQNIDIATQYGKGLEIKERFHEIEDPIIRTDMVIYAPSNLVLQLWSILGRASLKTWNAKAEIRSRTGAIRVEGVRAEELIVACPSCSVQLRDIRSSVRCWIESGTLEMNHVFGKSIYVETGSSPIKLFQIQGDQLYISKTGSMEGQFLRGKVEFNLQKGNVELSEVSGFLSGAVESGSIVARMRNWNFKDQAFLESGGGNIDLTLPRRFSGDVDLWTLQGKAASDFIIHPTRDLATANPEPSNHRVGRIHDGGELLKIFTTSGDVQVRSAEF